MYTCNAATGGEDSIAAAIHRRTNATVRGANGGTRYYDIHGGERTTKELGSKFHKFKRWFSAGEKTYPARNEPYLDPGVEWHTWP